MNFKIIIKIILICTISIKNLKADFFKDISDLIENNTPRLSYGVAVTDIDNDDKFDFIVTGYRYSNLALSYKKINYEILFIKIFLLIKIDKLLV